MQGGIERMTKLNVEEAIKALNAATHYDALWESFISSLSQAGADLVTYHHIAPQHASDAGRIDILSRGYPAIWEQYCRDENLSQHNPLFNTAYTRTQNFNWGEVLDRPTHDAEHNAAEIKFIKSMKDWLMGGGYMFPVFGPSGRNGYIAAGNLASIQDWTAECVQSIKCLSQEFHIRYVTLRLSETPSQFSLDDQEHNILNQIAAGRGVSAVAKAMNVEPKNIEAALDKLMLTMSVSDLPSLMICAKSLGLIKSE